MSVGWRLVLSFLFGMGAYASAGVFTLLGMALTVLAAWLFLFVVIDVFNVIDDRYKNRGDVSQ